MKVQLLHLKLNKHEGEQLLEDLKVVGKGTPGAIITALVARLEQDAEMAELTKVAMKNPIARKVLADVVPEDFEKIWETKKARVKAAIQQCLDLTQ